jgi:hypothetical protein
LKVKVSSMLIQRFSYFTPTPATTLYTGTESVALDNYVSKLDNLIYVFSRYKIDNTTYSPAVFSLSKDDFSFIEGSYSLSTSPLTRAAITQPVTTTPTYGRLQMCENLDFFVAAHNRDNTQTGFYIVTG